MAKHFVCILSKVDCEWEGLSPVYRLYVNDELFAERTWIWTDSALEENLQVEAEPGIYEVRYELLSPNLAQLKIGELSVGLGSAEIIDNMHFRIL